LKPDVLIVGGTGFVGRHLARQLSDRYDVRATGREQDIRDKGRMAALLAGMRPRFVVNLAAITTVRETIAAPRATYEVVFLGLLNLLEAMNEAGFDGRFLQVSSSEIYGHPHAVDMPLAEGSPVRPMSPYAVAKAAAELLCRQWAALARFGIVVARPFTHIGPGQSERFAVARFAAEIRRIQDRGAEPRVLVGNLGATRDLTDVRDVVRAYDLMLHAAPSGAVYNVCSGREVPMRRVLDELIRLSGIEIAVVADPTLTRKAEQQRLCGSPRALQEATGWRAEIPLERTLRDTLAAARDA